MATIRQKNKVRAPILPRSATDPTGQDARIRAASRDMRARVRKALKAYREALDQIPYVPIVNARYGFRVDPLLLDNLLRNAGIAVDDLFLEGGPQNVWIMDAYVKPAYQQGTAQSFANISAQVGTYRAANPSMQSLMVQEAYATRVALVAAREFEEMKGISGQIKADMARILTDGVGRGQNPRKVAQRLTEQAGIEARRAERIARTEIGTALRRARWDETDDATEQYGLTLRMMHLSALRHNTRRTHAARHGKIYTTEEIRDWYSQDANSINCQCSQSEILVDDDGKPVVPQLVDRALRTYNKMAARGYDWSQVPEGSRET